MWFEWNVFVYIVLADIMSFRKFSQIRLSKQGWLGLFSIIISAAQQHEINFFFNVAGWGGWQKATVEGKCWLDGVDDWRLPWIGGLELSVTKSEENQFPFCLSIPNWSLMPSWLYFFGNSQFERGNIQLTSFYHWPALPPLFWGASSTDSWLDRSTEIWPNLIIFWEPTAYFKFFLPSTTNWCLEFHQHRFTPRGIK